MKENEIENNAVYTDKDRCYTVYMHINKINKHFYIGITKLQLNQRFGRNGSNYKECTHFWNAIQLYGWNNFFHIIIADHLTKEQACEYEIKLIKCMKTRNKTGCYNILTGGDLGREDVVITEEYRNKFRGKNNPAAKSVICIETGEIFDTVTEATKRYNIDRSNIARSCRTGMACGTLNGVKLHWSYYDNVNNTFDVIEFRTNNRGVYCETTGLYFNSLKEASEHYDVPYDSIWYSCKNHSITSYGYVWSYISNMEGGCMNV